MPSEKFEKVLKFVVLLPIPLVAAGRSPGSTTTTDREDPAMKLRAFSIAMTVSTVFSAVYVLAAPFKF